MTPIYDRIWHNVRLAGPGDWTARDGALAVKDGRIAAVGTGDAIGRDAAEVTDGGGRLLTPALIDCHTHLVWGGSRAHEFRLRLAGASYERIAREGGGILSTVAATRDADVDDLIAAALPRLDALLSDGVSTVEVKSGYGLTIEAEIAMLRAARAVADLRPVRVVTSWLAAHALPPNYEHDRAGYLEDVVIAGLRQAHAEGLVDAVDGFCEGIAFTPEEMARVFDAAGALGLPVKLHAEQLSNLGGAAMAARYGALSADHLEYLDVEGAVAMAEAGTVAVLLPGAFYVLRETQHPPVDALREAGTRIALATDSNPGSSPLTSLLLAMNMGATLFGLTVEECLDGVTAHAAAALGMEDRIGTLAEGAAADLALWDVDDPAELVYRIGARPLHARIHAGMGA